MARRQEDWHPADIRAALEKRGWSFAQVDRAQSLQEGTARKTAVYPHIRGEEAIARVLGLHPRFIWPRRYAANGERLRPQPAANYKPQPRLMSRQKKQRGMNMPRTAEHSVTDMISMVEHERAARAKEAQS
ncbi:MAG: hypothetical protein Kow00104_02510 [Rhodothalassiaceae bacterium]